MTDEESLRRWAGGLLVHARDLPQLPPAGPVEILEFLRRHGIQVLVYERAFRHTVSPGWRDLAGWLRDDYRLSVAVEMARSHEVAWVMRHMTAHCRRRPVIIKGAALAYQIYDSPPARIRGDIDALVERSAVETIVGMLTALGYERVTAIDADLVLPQLSLHKQQYGASHVWDVHWRISNRPALAELLECPEIRENAVETRIHDAAFLAPGRVDSLLIACLHLIGHHPGEIRLIWLYDIHLLAAALSAAGRRRFLDKAMARPQARAACHAAFELTQRYLPAGPTDDLRRALDPGSGARWKVDRTYLAGLVEDAGAVGRGKRLRFVAQHVFPSAGYMMKRFGIRHRWQLPFWYAVRIGRAVPKLFRRR